MTELSDWSALLDPDADAPLVEDLATGGSCLLDFVAAVDFLRRGDRIDFTVWDALAEALRWWTTERVHTIEGAPDPELGDVPKSHREALDQSLSRLLAAIQLHPALTADVAIQQAVRRWTATNSNRHDGDRVPPGGQGGTTSRPEASCPTGSNAQHQHFGRT